MRRYALVACEIVAGSSLVVFYMYHETTTTERRAPMYCPNCGRELPHNDFAKCPYCGAPLSASAVDNTPTANPQGQILGQLPANYTGGNAQTVPSQSPTQPSGQPAPYPPGYAPPPAGPSGGYPYPQPSQPNQPYAPQAPGAMPSTPLTPPLYGQGYGPPPMAGAPGGYAPPGQGYGYGPPPQGGYAPPGYPPMQPPSQPPTQPPGRRRFSLPLIILSGAIVVALLIVAIVGAIKLEGRGTGTNTGNTTPTATHVSATATPSATVLFQDALTSNAKGWFDDGTHCFFKSDGYHIALSHFCTAPTTISSPNVTISVNVKEVNGSNDFPFGIVLRRSGQNYYAFEIDSQGDWVFFKAETNNNNYFKLHDFTGNAAIHTGLNVSNTLKVVVRENVFSCYVNGVLVGQVTDSSYVSGQVGLISEKYEAVFTDFLVTQP